MTRRNLRKLKKSNETSTINEEERVDVTNS